MEFRIGQNTCQPCKRGFLADSARSFSLAALRRAASEKEGFLGPGYPGWPSRRSVTRGYFLASLAGTYSELAALHQALAFYKDHGILIQRILTDRGSTYRSKLFAASCQQLGIRHLFTRPYRPQTNGKAERFIQTI